MEVIGSATQNSGRMRLFSRKDSENNYSDILVKWKKSFLQIKRKKPVYQKWFFIY